MNLTIEIEADDKDTLTDSLRDITNQLSEGYTEGKLLGPTLRYAYHLNDDSKPF